MTTIEAAVRRTLCQVIDDPPPAGDIDLDGDLFGRYGLTSLNMVVLMTSLCEETGTEMTRFTDKDIAGFRTPRQIIAGIEKLADGRP